MSDTTQRAIDSYEKDVRFRAVAMQAVSEAMREHGRVDPERADQEAHDIALRAVAVLLQRVYEEDRELVFARLERDHYKRVAEEFLLTAPLRVAVLTDRPQAPLGA